MTQERSREILVRGLTTVRVGARSCPYRLVLVVVVVEDRERRGGVVSPIVSRGAHSGRGVSMGPAGNQTLAPPRTGTRGMRGRPNQSGPPCDVTSCPLVNQDDGNFFLFCHFLLLSPSSSIPIRKQKTLYSGWRAGRGFEEGDTQSMARAEKAS